MGEREIRAALDRHGTPCAAGHLDTEHEIYHHEPICEYPQRATNAVEVVWRAFPGHVLAFAARRDLNRAV